ncbi:AraC family transcriptional regulator [uncultured Kordia sp.]|uniref:helix-turn-helix domain-containing protein n=1 Tax=uncultured Kordia sp. TaxID=507699 RepID=UPI00262B3772|nr:AraC family transcriptional regulator [uncultured Kordia sp.]
MIRTSPKKYCLLIFILICILHARAQEIVSDSLGSYSFKELSEKFHNSTNLKDVFAKYYLNKAKETNDTLHIARGYKLYTFMVSSSKAVQYGDSIIKVARNSKHRSYPAEGYILKAYYLYQKGEYNNSLDNYIIALPLAIKKKNIRQQLYIRQAIGSLKSRLGNYSEALNIFKEDLHYIESLPNYKTEHKKNYLQAIYNVSDSYLDMKILDSANVYIEKGVIESLVLNDSIIYHDFISASGYSKYFSKKYTEALNILNTTTPYLEGYSLGINYYYKGKCYKYLGKKEKMFAEFNRADSVYQTNKDLFPELQYIYEAFVKYHKKNKNTTQQLHYLEKLISVDSILDIENSYLNSKIIRKYDTRILQEEKKKLKEQIKSLHVQNIRSYRGLIFSLIFIIIIIIVLIYYYLLQRKYKRKFNEVIEKSKNQKIKPTKKRPSKVIKNKIGISQEIVDQILLKLDEFEKNNLFLNSDITVASLAKNIDTNTTYLSKVINAYRGKNFSVYLKELRVNYAIDQLQTNSTFRKYSIKAIAYEIGFNNVDYFSKAFSKITGIQPSYFIKQLEKQEKHTHNL